VIVSADGLRAWPGPCEDAWWYLAEHCPEQLVELLSAMEPRHATYAAEALGVAPSSIAIPALVGLLGHEVPHVREGAAYGLAPHLEASGEGPE